MIQAIILDIDGIIVGEKIGYNSPNPHPDVISALQRISDKDVPIILCTAKPHYAITDIIQEAHLANPHITDAGALIINPIDNTVIAQHILAKHLVKEILQVLLKENVYTEFYTVDNYFIQKSQASDISPKHAHILQRKIVELADIALASVKYDITKIMPIAKNTEDKKRVAKILEKFAGNVSISWGVHPVALPLQFGIITALGSSKKEGAEDTIRSLGLDFSHVLGIGDSVSDWQFMQLCGYKATLENGAEELKEKLSGEKDFISKKSVDENGILEVLEHFSP